MWIRRWLFCTSVFFLGSWAPSEKYLGPKQSPPISHNDLKKDGAQLLLSMYRYVLILCMYQSQILNSKYVWGIFCGKCRVRRNENLQHSHRMTSLRLVFIVGDCSEHQMMQDMLSESPRCNNMVAYLHFPPFFGIAIQCEIAWRFPRSVVKVGLNVQCKNISILSGVQPSTSTDLNLPYFNA